MSSVAHLNYATTNNRATVRERDRNISNAASTTADSYRVVVMLISHLPTSYTLLPAQSDPSSPQVFPTFVSSEIFMEGPEISLLIRPIFLRLDARMRVTKYTGVYNVRS